MKYLVYVQIPDLAGKLEFEVEANSEEEADLKGRQMLIDSAIIWSEESEEYGDCEDNNDNDDDEEY